MPKSALDCPFFHGRMTRDEAERLLLDATSRHFQNNSNNNNVNTNGVFLLRTTYQNDACDCFVLTVLFDRQPIHYALNQLPSSQFQLIPLAIRNVNDNFRSVNNDALPRFDGPVELVEYYSRISAGLACCLSLPICRRILATDGGTLAQPRVAAPPFDFEHYCDSPSRYTSPELFWQVTADDVLQNLQQSSETSYSDARAILSHWYKRRMSARLAQSLNDLTVKQTWYHASLTRAEAEKRLRDFDGRPGAFVVRRANKGKCLAVSLLCGRPASFRHYQIEIVGGIYSMENGPKFFTVIQLIDYYHNRPTDISGLAYRLLYPCVRTLRVNGASRRSSGEDSCSRTDNSTVANGITPQLSSVSSSANESVFEEVVPDNQSMHLSLSWLRTCGYFIPHEHVIQEHRLGQGHFGVVYKGTWIYSGHSKETYTHRLPDVISSQTVRGRLHIPVAIKKLNQPTVDLQDSLLKESNLMRELDHPHIVKFYGLSHMGSILLILEFAPLGDMKTHLRLSLQGKRRSIDVDELLLLVEQICSAFVAIAELKLVHRDVALRNILMKNEHHALVSDFGLSRAIRAEEEYYTAHNWGFWPVRWYPPEAIKHSKFGEASDVWSFGVTVWEIFSYGGRPYGTISSTEVLNMVERGERLHRPVAMPPAVYEILLRRCWLLSSKERGTFKTILAELHNVSTTLQNTIATEM